MLQVTLRFLPSKGYRKVVDLYDSQEDLDVIVDERARTFDFANVGTSVQSSTKMFKTAEGAEVLKLETLEGFELKATPWHKMYVERDGEVVKIPLAEVEIGDKILVQGAESAQFGDIDKVDEAFEAGSNYIVEGVPDFVKQGTRETLESYLSGLFGFHGYFNYEDQEEENSPLFVEVRNESKTLLQDVQRLLLTFGMRSELSYNGYDFSLSVKNSSDVLFIVTDLFVVNDTREQYTEDVLSRDFVGNNDFRATVKSIEFYGHEDVYDVTVENGHSLIFNGIATGNCSEILQASNPFYF